MKRSTPLLFLTLLFLICSVLFLISHEASPHALRSYKHIERFDSFVNTTLLSQRTNNLPFQQHMRIIILLQQSIVRPNKQMSRLRVIDATWAKWLHDDDHIYFAATNTASTSFQRLSPIQLTDTTSPFHRMVTSFLHIIIHEPSLDWIFYANDHTFLIPANLRSYLTTLSAEHLILAGNHLHLQYNRQDVYFISGGAGAVLSSTALHGVLVLWCVVHTELLEALIPPVSAECGDEILLYSSDETMLGYGCLLRWLSSPITLQTHFTLHLSSRATMTITRNKSAGDIHLSIDGREVVSPFSTLRTYCVCDTKWSLDNPGNASFACCANTSGVVLSACLQEALHVNALAATQNNEEIFNVYGPVRLMMGEVDEWYRDMKQQQHRDEVFPGHVPIPQRVASFHYVSEAECALLYEILSDQNKSLTPADIWQRWPRGSDVGDYSRPLHSMQEASKLHEILTEHVIIDS